ncbi:MAG: MFS transporter [Pseudomonadales bacterium]|nr:MFS transporter [Pseudomonadales bacterium]
MSKLEFRAAAAIGLLYIIRMLGLFMVLPVLPLLADSLSDATPFLIGIAMGVYGLSQAVLQIPLGLLSDKLGRKAVIAGGLIVFVIGSLVAGTADSVYGIIAGRFLQGCGAIASTLMALISDATRVENRSKAMAMVGMSIGASFGISLVIGPLINEHAGWQGVFLFSAASGIAGLLVLFGVVPSIRLPVKNPEVNINPARFGEIISDGRLLIVTLGVFMLHYLLMSSFLAFPHLFRLTGEIADSEHHLIYFWTLFSTFVLMGPFMWLSDKPGMAKPMLAVFITLLAAALLVMANAMTFYPVIAGLVLFFMGFNLMEVLLPSTVSKIAPAGGRGTAMGIYSTAQFAGAFAGGAVGGLLMQQWDISHLMYFNAGVCGVWFLLTVTMKQPGNYSTRIVQISPDDELTDKERTDALLSVNGVVDVVVLEKEALAYLKVDEDKFDDSALAGMGFRRETATA